VRPGYWIGVVGFLTIYMLITVVNHLLLRHQNIRQTALMVVVTILTLAAVILPVMDRCKARYHTLCLQDPNTFVFMTQVSVGLTSVRTVWNHTPPYYSDPFLVKNFHDRCPVTSLIGNLNSDNTNLLSCMFHAPHLMVVYFVKKMTGLFDTFRMTPNTEHLTPAWYIWVARVFSSIAFVGFWILLWEGLKGTYHLIIHRRPVSALIAAAWAFCILEVSMHAILHVEERYAFSWIPFCIIAIFLKIKAIQAKNYPPKLSWLWLIFAALVMFGYFIQVAVWDNGVSHW